MEVGSKDKVIRLFNFLKEYNNKKNPIILDMEYQKEKRCLDDLPRCKEVINNIYNDNDDGVILSVKRPVLEECPKPPQSLDGWINEDWNDLNVEVIIKGEIEIENEAYGMDVENKNKFITIKFEDDDLRTKDFEIWNNIREEWVNREKINRKVDALFNEFYLLYATIKKESESVELMIGDGILIYNKEQKIHHPILLQNVKLNFDADIPEFTLTFGDRDVELYRSLFHNISDINEELLKGIYNDFESKNYSPIEVSNTNSFLNRVANALSFNGKFVKCESELNHSANYLQIYRKPILLLRKRNLGFGVAIDSIIDDINLLEEEKIPSFLMDIAGIERTIVKSAISEDTKKLNINGIDNKILLTKQANSEQLAVAKYLERYGAVLVQGPPGTGKTHTIANLVGHLLAQGKSILITSYSEKALSVLKAKVTKNLQALCLSLLSNVESRQEMEGTLDQINENRSRLDINTLDKEINQLEIARAEQIEKLDNLRMNLKNIIMNEYRHITIGGKEFTPIEAGKYINENKDKYAWIPQPITQGVLLPLSDQEIEYLYKTNTNLTKEDEREYECKLPNILELPSPMEFSELVIGKNKFSEEKLNQYIKFWNRNDKYTVEELKEIVNNLSSGLEYIDVNKEWVLATIEAATDETIRSQWMNLIVDVNKVYEMSVCAAEQIIKYNPKIVVAHKDVDVKKQLQTIINKLEKGSKITRFDLILNSDMKSTINMFTVNGMVPKTIDQFKAIDTFNDLCSAKEQLKNRWNRQIVPLGADATDKMGDGFERICKKYCDRIADNLEWYFKYWNETVERVQVFGLDVNAIDKDNDLSIDRFSHIKFIKYNLGPKLIEVIKSEIYRIEYDKYKKKYEKLTNITNKYSSGQNSSIVNQFQEAIINNDINKYKVVYEKFVDFNEKIDAIKKRKALLDRLAKVAPKWAQNIEERNGIYGCDKPESDIRKSWIYTQFLQEINCRNATSIENVQNEIFNEETKIKANTSELAFKKAWRAKLLQFSNNRKQVQAIEGWRQIIRKIGNGKSKKAEALKVEARKLMPQCQSAIPVWIMPLSKVVENFNPHENKFDVVIIDEASQADFMALVALYLGKQVIIVGDNEQVSPLAIGENSDDVSRLVNEYLFDYNIAIKSLCSGTFSIYDLAATAGYQPIRLKEHFRCVPEIIQYCNVLSYNGMIKPLRDASMVVTKPHIITYKVENATSNNKVNKKEAETIVSLILSCCENEEYKGKTFGVITLRGERQATEIDKLLQAKMIPSEYRKREILCGNSANFQGDERDIIFLSMVDTNNSTTPLRLYGFGNDEMYKKRYNVAVSRAKDQIWLVHSISSDIDLKSGDIRKNLLDYFINYKNRETEYKINETKAESEFERRVMKYLIDKGYKIVPQWKVGEYRIDMVAIYKDMKVAIECDGERWHGEDKIEQDMNRQAILERLGWRFIRIRGSEFFKDEAFAMDKVYKKLTDMDILSGEVSTNLNSEGNIKLKENIISRAEAILSEWKVI